MDTSTSATSDMLSNLHSLWAACIGQRGLSLVNSIYQLVDEEWIEISSMSRGRSLCLVVTPSPRKMMVVGGLGGGNIVEEYVVV